MRLLYTGVKAVCCPLPQEPPSFLHGLVDPWYAALKEPAKAQLGALMGLLSGYEKTTYGSEHCAAKVRSFEDFQKAFPVVTYADLRPLLDSVRLGRYSSLLPEPVARWVMTRGTTGSSKVIPATQTQLDQILTLGARAVVNHTLRTGDLSVLEKPVLNLNFPSEVATMSTPAGDERYGYSSGTYAKLNPSLGGAALLPSQEKIDALGGGISRPDWDARFELVYEEARDKDVGSVMGVTQVMVAFASYLRRKKKTLPAKLWKMRGLFCTSAAKIQSRYAPLLRHEYGEAALVEMYTATEGVFAQQLDDNPYVCPNYDAYVFEVQTGRGTKMLHDLLPREWGSLVVSTQTFPRYAIGDYVEALGKGYYRIFGRVKVSTAVEHLLYNAFTLRFV
jgi:GH3 auxin-responsive promoter